MKSSYFCVLRFILSAILCALVFWPCSCRSYDQLGETTAEEEFDLWRRSLITSPV